MRIAFYAPLKPPTHPVPSGDRRMARLLMAALGRANHRIELASRFRSRDGSGDPARQQALADLGQHLARRLVRQYQARPAAERPAMWFTYHVYYKAPDWLGPAVSAALDIPYVVAEVSHAGKRAVGTWAVGHAGATAAIAQADAIINLNPADVAGLAGVADPSAILVMLKPFIDGADFAAAANRRDALRKDLAQRFGLDGEKPWLLAVAMMREGDKLASFRLLATALERVRDRGWQLLVVGDGPARAAVEAALAPLGRARVHYAGRRLAEELPQFYAPADLLVWPAVNEAYGMALLEAQAAGVPVVAGATGGVPTVVAGDRTGLLTVPGDAGDFAAAVRALLDDPARRQKMGEVAKELIAEEHDIGTAARILDRAVHDAANRHRRLQ
jgi:glycosyltransferase involved in cell wall biosynthesis